MHSLINFIADFEHMRVASVNSVLTFQNVGIFK